MLDVDQEHPAHRVPGNHVSQVKGRAGALVFSNPDHRHPGVVSIEDSNGARARALATTAKLEIRCVHNSPAAGLLVWIDDKLAYETALSGTVRKRLGLIQGVQEACTDTLLNFSNRYHTAKQRAAFLMLDPLKESSVGTVMDYEGEKSSRAKQISF